MKSLDLCLQQLLTTCVEESTQLKSNKINQQSSKQTQLIYQRLSTPNRKDYSYLKQKEPDYSFRPKINRPSPHNSGQAFERLYTYGKHLLLSKSIKQRDLIPPEKHTPQRVFTPDFNKKVYQPRKTPKLEETYSFEPRILTNSRNLSTSKRPLWEPKQRYEPETNTQSTTKIHLDSFLRRQKVAEAKRQQSIQQIATNAAKEETFEPKINEISLILSKSAVRTPLTQRGVKKSSFVEEFSFKPEINESSKFISKRQSKYYDYQYQMKEKSLKLERLKKQQEMLRNEEKKLEMQKIREIKENQQQYDVKSKINIGNMTDYYRSKIVQREIMQKQAQLIKSKQELSQCTFYPVIKK